MEEEGDEVYLAGRWTCLARLGIVQVQRAAIAQATWTDAPRKRSHPTEVEAVDESASRRSAMMKRALARPLLPQEQMPPKPDVIAHAQSSA